VALFAGEKNKLGLIDASAAWRRVGVRALEWRTAASWRPRGGIDGVAQQAKQQRWAGGYTRLDAVNGICQQSAARRTPAGRGGKISG